MLVSYCKSSNAAAMPSIDALRSPSVPEAGAEREARVIGCSAAAPGEACGRAVLAGVGEPDVGRELVAEFVADAKPDIELPSPEPTARLGSLRCRSSIQTTAREHRSASLKWLPERIRSIGAIEQAHASPTAAPAPGLPRTVSGHLHRASALASHSEAGRAHIGYSTSLNSRLKISPTGITVAARGSAGSNPGSAIAMKSPGSTGNIRIFRTISKLLPRSAND